MVILIFLYLILVIGIVIYHYFQLKNTVEIIGQISTAQTEKINRGKMSFSISKTEIKYTFNAQKYSSMFDTDLIENIENNEIPLLVNFSKPNKVHINTTKGKWLEKCYLILFFSIALLFLLLFFGAKN